MLKGRGRDPKAAVPPTPTMSIRSVTRLSKPEPDYEVVEFPTEQYVNAKLQPPPPPPRPPTGHPFEAGASCGLCGGGGARVRCAECGRRALCASCDDMYHRHPKRRHHQRQALSLSQLREERPPLPPKTGPPVPPPRKHKVAGDRSSGSPRLPTLDQRRMTLNSMPPNEMSASHIPLAPVSNPNHFTAQRSQPPALSTHLQMNIASNSHLGHLGSMSYQSETMHHTQAPVAPTLKQSNSLGLVPNPWGRQRGSLPGFIPPNTGLPLPVEPWEIPEGTHSTQSWNRPLRRGTSVMELGIGPPQTNPNCAGCAHCLGQPWRYGSCASLDHTWTNTWAPNCCVPPHPQHTSRLPLHHQVHHHIPQAYRKAESRAVSRATSRADSRAPSPATSTRSRTSRRPKHRTPSPQPLPSSDADSENEEESDHKAAKQETEEDLLGPPPSPPEASWQCEHCTFVNEPGVRVCVVCCRTPTISPRIINTASIKNGMKELKLYDNRSPAIDRNTTEEIVSKRGQEKSKTKIQNARTSTACGPSPPRDEKVVRKSVNRLATPARDEPSHNCQMKQEVAVGPSPPKETETRKNSNQTQLSTAMKTAHPNSIPEDKPMRRSVSVGPSPPREQIIQKSHVQATINNQKKSIGTSPPRKTFIDTPASVFSSTSSRVNISNTGTSPPPQSISTQTYDVTNTAREWERASSVLRSRARRRFREEGRRERSHSRHSLSSDTRESERSVRTSGGGNLGPGRWEWREPRDSSPGGEWSGSERHRSSQLSRRASHLDLRRTRSSRRSSAYGSEAPSPEPFTENRAVSLEVLAGVGARRETERGLELARLMGEAEKLGFSAAEVHAALAQNPAAPLTWLRERWPSLCAGVRAAAVRLVPEAVISERDARTALARHRGAMWPAVTDCVEKWRRQRNTIGLENEGRLRGHVWGSPTGIEDDAAPPTDHSHRMRAEESSDEFEFTARNIQDDDWMYLPLENNKFEEIFLQKAQVDTSIVENEDIAFKLKTLLIQAGIPNINEQLLLKGLLANHNNIPTEEDTNVQNPTNFNIKQNSNDFVQSENDFIEAYNALTRLSPLPIINKLNNVVDSHDHISNNHNSDIGINEKKQCLNSINIVSNTNNMKQKGSNIQRPEADNLKINKDIKTQPSTLETGHGSQKITITRSKIKKLKEPNNSVNVKVIQPIKNKSETYNSDSQEDEKADNLNEIVDNTQKLIQQMKKELNSDIRSLDSRSNTKSESDTLSSEKESSYTDTENETEDISSEDNENEISNTKDENEAHRRTIKRTSSEDNEQFEEAIDHLEVQISNLDEHNFNNLEHDFKQSNIEILNSIAKKLQEEQSLSVQTHVTRISQNVQQDVNNNLYNTVNSFEEIYDELTDAKSNIIKESSLLRVINNSDQNVPLKERKTLYKKEDIMFINYFPPSAATILLSKIEHPLIQATLDVAILDTNNSINKNENKIQEELLDNIDNFIVESKTISIPNMHEDFKIPADNTSVDIDKDDVSSQSQSTNLDTENDVSKIEEAETDETAMNQKISKINQQGNEEENDDKLYNSVEINTTKTDDIESLESIEIIRNKKKNSTFNKGFFNKSNIPKLVKALQNNKLKIEKTPLKVLGSKVPVRRTSLKHYPAPAPPKQFDKIQNGHVKQLQTKLFNNKSQNITNISTEIEVKPSTSTNSILTKKKPAPLPPAASEHNQQSSPKHVTEKEIENKNNYFRETCRTEDEWTESDSEEFKMPFTKQNNDPDLTPFSPPVPITVRRVSGQLIDLATIRLPEGSPERQARMLLAEGATENWIQAQLAVELISRGINSPSALLAALECTDLNSALTYLHQDCELCASRLPEYEMVSMLRCTHRCCRECARHYFTVQITERNIADCVCPYCKEPELENRPEDDWLEYFAHLDILLKTLLNTDVHELFQRKLRDRTLARDPNFKWCVECSSGFFVHPKQKKLRCPECKSVSCASCRKPWSSNHEGITCDQYTKWLEDNDPERSVAAVHQHLRENGLECPRCHFKYSLSRGGCMHFTCTQCKYEFCYGCGKPFMMGARCGLSEYCAKLGLHAHHPRNCLFYLRDKEPHELQTLLQMNNVTYETKASEGGAGRCPIQLQRETPTGLVDGACGSDASPNHAGLCKNHYLEYLSRLVRSQHIDPLPILGVDDLETLVRRAALRLPPRPYGTLEGLYKRGLIEIVREKIPLD